MPQDLRDCQWGRQKELCHVKCNTLCVVFVSKKGNSFIPRAYFAHTLTQSYCCSYGSCCFGNEPLLLQHGNDRAAIFTALNAKC